MARIAVSILLAMVCSLVGMPQEDTTASRLSYTTKISGELWQMFPLEVKAAYVAGFLDADETHRAHLRVVGKASAEVRLLIEAFEMRNPPLRPAPLDQIIEGVDHFYSDYRNKHIHVVSALRIVALEIAGKPASEIELRTREFRQLFQQY